MSEQQNPDLKESRFDAEPESLSARALYRLTGSLNHEDARESRDDCRCYPRRLRCYSSFPAGKGGTGAMLATVGRGGRPGDANTSVPSRPARG
jgi:hypothetical protein